MQIMSGEDERGKKTLCCGRHFGSYLGLVGLGTVAERFPLRLLGGR